MDALALLCTLHADGPSTLRELRSAGCHDLLDLIASDPQDLSECLDLPLPAAERLQREARLLGSRMQLLEPEDQVDEFEVEAVRVETSVETEPEVEVVAPRVIKPLPPSMSGSRANRSWFNATRIPLACSQRQTNAIDLDIEVAPFPSETVSVEALENVTEAPEVVAVETVAIEAEVVEEGSIAPLAEVVVEEPPSHEAAQPETIAVEVEPAFLSEKPANKPVLEPTQHLLEAAKVRKRSWPRVKQAAQEEREEVRVDSPTSETDNEFVPLEVGLLDGLDSELLQLLESADIRSIESLVLASGLDLSRKLSIPFTRLLELQLAAQHLVRNPLGKKPASSKPAIMPVVQDATEPSITISPAQRRRHTDTLTKQSFPLPSKVDTPPFDQSLADLSGSVGGPFA